MMFVSYLSDRIKASSIKVYLAGIRSLHIENGFKNPLENCLRLERVIRGTKREQGSSVRPRLPITITILSRIQSLLDPENYSDSLFWAACCLGFFGFLRCGEFTTSSGSFAPSTDLSLDDVQVDRTINPTVLLLRIKASKTDQFRKGHTVRIGATGAKICPIRALMSFLHLRGSGPGPLLRHETGEALSRQTFLSWLQSSLALLGIEGNYSGHSFRIGAATTAATVGIPDHLIKTMGRWLSDAYQLYIRTPSVVLEQVAARLVGNT